MDGTDADVERQVDEQMALLGSGVDTLLPEGELRRKLLEVAKGERGPLRVKFGMDPTAPDIHIGHAVVLRKLRVFQELGHTVVLIVGGFTAQLGDPSGRSATRPPLSAEQVRANAATYVEQAGRVLLPHNLEIVNNSDWLSPMTVTDLLPLMSRLTVARMLERKDFADRYRSQRPIALSELLYPLLQGFDSVEVRADVELGGTDQTFNLVVGRDLQVADGQEPQVVMVMPLLEGLDGDKKMSKSLGNAIGVTDDPADMFGKVMSIPDAIMPRYYLLASGLPPAEIKQVTEALADGTLRPVDAKRRLARRIVEIYHSAEAAALAEQRFDTQFKEHRIPDDIPRANLAALGDADEWFLPTLLVKTGLAASSSEARRLVAEGAVKLDGEPLSDPTATIPAGDLRGRVLQRGKRRYVALD
jgi:tyrosyl-tRNA synthetase